MSITSVLTAAETTFKANLTLVKSANIKQYPGPFNPIAIADQSFSSKAVFFGSLGARDDNRSSDDRMLLANQYGDTVFAARFIAVCVGKHAGSAVKANAQATMVAEQLMMVLNRQSWGLNYVTRAFNRSIEPMLTASRQKDRLAFWRVQWWHFISINGAAIESSWANLENFEGWDSWAILPELDTATFDKQNDTPVMNTTVDHPQD